MKIEPQKSNMDTYSGLTPDENRNRKAAILFVFAGVFIWGIKIFLA